MNSSYREHTYCIWVHTCPQAFPTNGAHRQHFWFASKLYLICVHIQYNVWLNPTWYVWKRGEAGSFNQLPVLICELAWKEEAGDSLIPLSAFLIKYTLLVGLSSRRQRDVYVCVDFMNLQVFCDTGVVYFMMQNILHYEWHHEHEGREGKNLNALVWVWARACVRVCSCSYSLGAASCDV